MLQFCSLYSGSTGNSLFVQSDNTKILVDAGVSAKKITEALASMSIDINAIDAILVTHEHIDHVKSLSTLSTKYNIPVFATQKTWEAMPENQTKIALENQKIFDVQDKFEVGNLQINPFSIPHDAADPCGFNILCDNRKISIATDIGHMTKEIVKRLEDSSLLMLEANYDPEVLKCGSYPYRLKTRILGPTGHLSNSSAGKTISLLLHSGLNTAILGHLSKENNFPELAYSTVLEELRLNNCNSEKLNLNVASRSEPSKLFQVC